MGYHMASNVARKATAFPLWSAIDKHWNRNTICLVSSVTAVMHLPISGTCSFNCHWQKDVRCRQRTILHNLVLCCLVCCWACFSGSLIYTANRKNTPKCFLICSLQNLTNCDKIWHIMCGVNLSYRNGNVFCLSWIVCLSYFVKLSIHILQVNSS